MSERSALYPLVTFETCIDFIKVVDSFKFKMVSYHEVAKKLGLSSITTKSFTGKISTAKQFGLIATADKTIQLTDTAKNILYPTEPDIHQIEVECFRQPPLYARLIERFDGKALPSKEVLSNLLMKEFRITQSAKDNAAQAFLDSAEYLGLIQGGVLQVSCEIVGTLRQEELQAQTSEASLKTVEEKPDPVRTKLYSDSDYYTQSVPTNSGKIAEIRVPIDANEDDLFLIQDLLHSIMRRKFHIDPNE